MLIFLLVPLAFILGGFSRYTIVIDRVIIAGILFIFGFTPLISTAIPGLENGPNFHARDFIGPWVWLFSESSYQTQLAIILTVVSYFAGKFFAFIYLVKKYLIANTNNNTDSPTFKPKL